MRVTTVTILLLLGASFVQSTWLGAVAVLGVIPDLSLLILIWVSYRNGPVEGPTAGFVAGLADDCLSAAPLGFNAFVKTSVAWLASFLHGSFAIDRVLLPLLLGFLGTVAKALATLVLALLFGHAVRSYDLLSRGLWIEAAYNGLVAPLVFLLLSLTKGLLVRGRQDA